MLKKRLVTLSLVSTILFSSFSPSLAPRAHAFLGVGDFGYDIEDVVKFALDTIAVPIAQQMVDEMVKSTIEWANTGFNGGPAYVTDPKGYFANTADNVAGSFIEGSDLGFLCSPFRNAVKVSLKNYYFTPKQEQYRCSISGIKGNIDDFYNNFNNGGWEAWLSMTQVSTNNPYGAYLTARIDLDSRVSESVTLSKSQYAINQGFKSLAGCKTENPDEDVLTILAKVEEGLDLMSIPVGDLNAAGLEARKIIEGKKPYKLDKAGGVCIEEGAIKTAGATIKSQLDRILPSGMERLINADQMSELVGAFASGILKRYVFGDRGLFASNNEKNTSYRETVDVDGDGVADGYDTDNDGELNICHNGLKPKPDNVASSDWRPNNNNCIKSTEAINSPFFIPICEVTSNSSVALKNYFDFMDRNSFGAMPGLSNFDKKYVNSILDKTTSAIGAIDNMISEIRRYESPAYDNVLFALGGYSKQLNNIILSLAKNNDMHGDSLQDTDTGEKAVLLSNTTKIINLLNEFRATIGNKCEAPDENTIGGIALPEIDLGRTGGNEMGQLSCSANVLTTNIGGSVVWSAQTTVSSPSYTWIGDEIPRSSSPTVTTTYQTVGTKSAGVSVMGLDADGNQVSLTTFCLDTVSVYDGNEQ